MRIAIIGYGKMGKRIHALAKARGHEISFIISRNKSDEIQMINSSNTDVAIDFTHADFAELVISDLIKKKIAVVSGTTGWDSELEKLKDDLSGMDISFFHASNFSYSLFIFNAINKHLAKLMGGFPEYNIQIDETHHIHKKDSPSGTAITLAETILNETNNKDHWVNNKSHNELALEILSHRKAEVPGTHQVSYVSKMDEINIKHIAKNRDVFVEGALDAAEFIFGKTGIFTMDHLVSSKLNL